MTHCEQAIQDYIDFYGRINREDMLEFFGMAKSNLRSNDDPLFHIRREVFNRRDPEMTGIEAYCKIKDVEFLQIREVNKVIVKENLQNYLRRRYE